MSNKIMLEYIKKWFRKNGWELEREDEFYLGFIKENKIETYIINKNLTEKDKDDFIIFMTDNI